MRPPLPCPISILFIILTILFISQRIGAEQIKEKEPEMNFDWTRVKFAESDDPSPTKLKAHDQQVFYKLKPLINTKRRVRSISDAVIETTRCEHIELMDCDSYDSDEMTCMITATGFPCCICSGKLKAHKRRWSLW